MDRSERDALDRHITGNYGEDQLRETAAEEHGENADYLAWRNRQTVPHFDAADCSGAFDGFGVVSDADPGL